MDSAVFLQLLAVARNAPQDETAALRLAAFVVDSGAVNLSRAAAIFRHLLTLNPAGLGWAAWGRFLNARDDAAAVALLRRAARVTAGRAQTWSDYANALQKIKSPLAAAVGLRALALAPSDADYLFNVGCDWQDADRLNEAERLLRRACRLASHQPEIWARAAGVAFRRGDLATAKRRAACAFALAPASPAAANVWGMALLRQKHADAIVWFRRALCVAPNYAEARLNLALCDLEAGRLAAGWRNYESRFASRGYVEGASNAPRWRGEPLAGKRLLVWREQGVGDEILFSACLKELIGAGAETVVRCDRRLVSLFSRSFPSIRFIPDGREITQPFDYHAPMGSLPGLTRRTLADFASVGTAAWLRPNETAATAWRRRLAALPSGLMIGVAWKSGLIASDRQAMYTALVDWLPLFKKAGVNLINLQYGQCEEEILHVEEKFGVTLWRWSDLDLKDDFEQTAALVSQLDLIICPATAVGELAGALGVCVWRLGAPDWTFLGAAVRPWFSWQRPILPKGGAPNSAIFSVIAKELDRLMSRRQSAPPAPAQEKPLSLTALQAHPCAPASHQYGADDPARRLAGGAVIGDQPDQAEHRYRLAVVTAPEDRRRLVEMSAAYIRRGALREAAQVLNWALRLDANDAETWSSYGLALERLNRDSEAEEAYRQAIALNSGHATSHDNLGMLQLKRGALRDGYAHRDWRFSTPRFAGMVKPSSAPLWRGENLAGKSLFVWREQGIGDEVMFAACYGALSARAGQVTAQCDDRLLGLFARSFPQVTFIAVGAPPPPHDAQIPAGTLLRRLCGSLAAFPIQSRFLTVEPNRSAVWRERLAALGPGLKIGLAWRGEAIAKEWKSASFDICDWGPFFNLAGAQFINIQAGDVGAELARARDRFGIDINCFSDLDFANDLENAAALMSALDLVLSPAVLAAELAAAVGTPTWRLAPRDWTSLGTAVRPSYPAMRNWSTPPGVSLAQTAIIMAAALRRLMEGRNAAAPPANSDAKERMKAALSAFDAGQTAQAAAAFASIIADDPQAFSAWAGLGACRAQLGENGAAVTALTRGVSLNPADPAALTTLGNVAAAMGRHGDGVKFQQRAVRLAPGFFFAWDNLGVVLLALGRDGEAARCHRQALAGMAHSVGAWSNYAAALRSLGRFEAAREALDKALALAPDDPGVFACLTQLLRRTESEPLANPWMGRAVRLAPAFPAIAFNHGLELLRAGRLADGVAGYERRFDVPELAFARPNLPGALWRGQNLQGKRLLIWGEQGVGDQLLFASALQDVLARAHQEGGRLALAFDPRLAGLLASSFPAAEVIADLAAPGTVDYHCGAGSLAAVFRRRLADFPGDSGGYVRSDPALAAVWRRRVATLPVGPRVGVAWRSGLITGERSAEYFQLTDLAEVLRAPQIVAVNLQYGADAETAAATSAGMRIFQWPDLDLKNDFSSVAALISNLDLVVAPATSVAELSAAAGVPTWRLSLHGDWTQLGVGVRPWLPTQKILTPRRGETIRDLSRRIAKLLAETL